MKIHCQFVALPYISLVSSFAIEYLYYSECGKLRKRTKGLNETIAMNENSLSFHFPFSFHFFLLFS